MSADQQEILAELKAVRALLERMLVGITVAFASREDAMAHAADFTEAWNRVRLAAPLMPSELKEAALEKTIERRKRMVEHWCEPASLQRMLRAISNDLNARDLQAMDRRTT